VARARREDANHEQRVHSEPRSWHPGRLRRSQAGERFADVSRPIQSRPVGQAVPAEAVLDTMPEVWDNFDSLFRESVPSHESQFSFRYKSSINNDLYPLTFFDSEAVPIEVP
jgi:hypothetical protein